MVPWDGKTGLSFNHYIILSSPCHKNPRDFLGIFMGIDGCECKEPWRYFGYIFGCILAPSRSLPRIKDSSRREGIYGARSGRNLSCFLAPYIPSQAAKIPYAWEGMGRAGNLDIDTPALPIPSAAKYLMRRGWVHTRPKYFMRVGRDRGAAWVSYAPLSLPPYLSIIPPDGGLRQHIPLAAELGSRDPKRRLKYC